MSFQGKRELLLQTAPRYQAASHGHKSIILDEFVAATGYERKYAIRLLTHPVAPPAPIRRPRAPHYGPAVQEALRIAWAASNGICAKRLVPFLPELVPILERHGHLSLGADVRAQLLAISPATADRLLRTARGSTQPYGISTTKHGTLLKHHIPVRTFTDWNDARPAFMEADLVAHCGGHADGAFLHTLVLTDIATGWTECLPLLQRSGGAVIHALDRVRQLLPFPLLGVDTDNGSEFLTTELLAYCRREQITFTRGRPGKKNDQCFVEQKNGAIVRQVIGYDRVDGQAAYRQLTEVYRAVRLHVNFFQPSMKLLHKRREGSSVYRKYDRAQTPWQRLQAQTTLAPKTQARLDTIYYALDPVRLLEQLATLQAALWTHAIVQSVTTASQVPGSPSAAIRFTAPVAGGDSTSPHCDGGSGAAERAGPRGPAIQTAVSSDEVHSWTADLSDAAGPVCRRVGGSLWLADQCARTYCQIDLYRPPNALSRPVSRCTAADTAAACRRVAGTDDFGL
jgi:hypothetical protein